MDPSRVVIWLVSDVLLGLFHVILFSAKIAVFSGGHSEGKREVWMPFLGTGVLFAYTITLLATHMGQFAQALIDAPFQDSDRRFLCVVAAGTALLLLVICTALFTLTSNDIINEAELGLASEKRNIKRIGYISVALSLMGLTVSFTIFLLASSMRG